MGCEEAPISCEPCACSSCVAVADASHFTVWLHAAEDSQTLQCSPSCTFGLQEKAGAAPHKKPAAARLPDIKDLIFVFSIVLSSRICGGARSEEQLRVHPCAGKSNFLEKLLGSVWLWGAACAALLLLLLFPPLLSHEMPAAGDGRQYTMAPHKRSGRLGQYMNKASALSPAGIPSLLVFQEAPPFRNQMGCPLGAGKLVETHVCDPSSVHIVMTLDGPYLRGSIAAVFSILQHAACPENVVFHFLVTEYHGYFRSLMRSTFPSLRFKIYHFEASMVRERISSSVRQALEQPLNYARNYVADMLEPCVRRVIYLDSDLVVVDDIFKLWTTKLGSHIVAAPEYCQANFSKYFSSSFWEDAVLARTFDGRKPCYFNTGVMVIDLDKWRQQNCTNKIEQWMQVQKERRIYELGSLPPFLLVFAGAVEPVDHRWNQHGLGGDNVKGSCRPLHLGPVSLLHWSGEGKPWARLDSRHPCPLDSLWAPFDLYVNSVYS